MRVVDGVLLYLDKTHQQIWLFEIPDVAEQKRIDVCNVQWSTDLGLDELAEDESRYFHVGSWDTLHEVLVKLDKHAVMRISSPENPRIVSREAFLGRYLRRLFAFVR